MDVNLFFDFLRTPRTHKEVCDAFDLTGNKASSLLYNFSKNGKLSIVKKIGNKNLYQVSDKITKKICIHCKVRLNKIYFSSSNMICNDCYTNEKFYTPTFIDTTYLLQINKDLTRKINYLNIELYLLKHDRI